MNTTSSRRPSATTTAAPKGRKSTTATPKETTVTKPAATTKKADAPKGRNFAALADKEPTELHKNFAAWLQEQTGVEVDLKTVQLVAVLRMDYQRSEANQASLKARQEAAAKKEQARKEAKRQRLLKEAAALGLTFADKA